MVVSATYSPPTGQPVRAQTGLTVQETAAQPVALVLQGWPDTSGRVLRVGDNLVLYAVARYQDGSFSDPLVATWSSSAPAVASVGSVGRLQALARGSFSVIAAAAGLSVTSPSWTVERVGRPPVVTATCVPCVVPVGDGVFLDAQTASDPDGEPLTVRWTAGAGIVRYPDRFRTYWSLPPHLGVFDVTVVVSDPSGNTASDTLTVTVTEPRQ